MRAGLIHQPAHRAAETSQDSPITVVNLTLENLAAFLAMLRTSAPIPKAYNPSSCSITPL